MNGPSWLPDTFAAIMLAVAVLSAARLAVAGARRVARETGSDADVAHLLMAVAMAGTLDTGLKILPAGVWEVVFGVATVWFAGRAALEARGQSVTGWTRACHLPHLVHSVAMLYMFLAATAAPAMSAGGGMGGMGGSGGAMTLRAPVLALVFALLLAGYAVRDLDGITDPVASGLAHAVPAPVRSRRPVLAPAGRPAPGLAAAVPVPVSGRVGRATFGESNLAPALNGAAPSRPAGLVPALLSPRLAVGCRVLMGVTMAYMLVVMI